MLDVRRKFFTRKVARPWHGLLREAVGIPTLDMLEGQAGRGAGQPELKGDSPTHGRGLKLDDL